MPCYEVRTMSVEFKAKHEDVLVQALVRLGWDYTRVGNSYRIWGGKIVIDRDNGEAIIEEGLQDQLNELKRTYSSAALDRVVKANLWQRKNTDQNKGILRRF